MFSKTVSAVFFLSAAAFASTAQACTIPNPEDRMQSADVVVVGSGEFVGEKGVIHAREVKKGKSASTFETRAHIECEGTMTPDARREAIAALMRRHETMSGTFYLRRIEGGMFLVDIFVPSNPSAQVAGARQEH